MDAEMPESLRAEQRAVEALIYERFRGVTREGGVSWSESFVIDDYGTEEECREARARDLDRSWEELVDDPNWFIGESVGGFSFLDPIGWRYYIAPMMIRWVRAGFDENMGLDLDLGSESGEHRTWRLQKVALLDQSQCQAVAAVIRFMIHVCEWQYSECDLLPGFWIEAMKSYWFQFE